MPCARRSPIAFTLAARLTRGLAALAACVVLAGPAAADEILYRAQTGDTLMGLAEALLADPADWATLQRINGVADPRRIPVGTELRIPIRLMRPFPRSAEVSAVSGDARVDGRDAAPGRRVGAGSSLETGDDGHIAIALPDGSLLELPARSSARIERLQGYAGTDAQTLDLSLDKGRVESRVAPQRGPAARYRVDTPTAVIGVRGTDFRVAWDDVAGHSRAEVLSGQVGVRTLRATREQALDQGFGVLAGASGVGSAMALPAAPSLEGLPNLFERPLLRIPMPTSGDYTRWRARVVPAEADVPVYFDAIVDAGEARVSGLADGDYRLLLRAIDASGLEGYDAAHPFRLKARPEPPFTTQPQPASKTSAGRVSFAWTQAPEAAAYLFEAVPADGGEPQASRLDVAGTRLELAPGDYTWRVASVRADGDRGPWSDPVPFTVRPLQAPPEPPLIDDDEMSFRWVGEPGQRFEYQFAADAAFSRLLAEGGVDVPEVVIARPAPDTYYMRIRAIDPDGFVSPWSGIQQVIVPASLPWWMLLPLLVL